MQLPRGVELVNPAVRRGEFRVALFDFDGTLSLIREGWPRIMIEMMLARLREQRLIPEPEPACAVHIEAFVMGLNGHPTLRQMERFAEEVTTRGGQAEPPAVYLQDYLTRLMSVVQQRWHALESRAAQPSDWVVPQSHAVLQNLRARGVPLFVASGTDYSHVSREVELLELFPLVGGRVFAPKDNDANFRKRHVIEHALQHCAAPGTALIGFGDGVVETQEVKRVGGVAVGVASSEAGVCDVNATKRDTLIAAGADIIIPHYESAGLLLEWLWNAEN